MLAQENGKGYLTYHFNNVGSTMAVTDKAGNISAKYNYSPYGELIEGEYDNNIQFLYNGQYGVATDGNGLYYMRARYYNVDIKRFINQDVLTGTLERISSLNRYSYVEGNPVSYLDPFGLEKSMLTQLHEGIAIVQDILLIGMVLTATATTLLTATGNLIAAQVFMSLFVTFSTTSNVLSAVDTVVCTIDFLTLDNKNEKNKALVSALFALLSIVAPFQEYIEYDEIIFTSVTNLKDTLSSVIQWIASGGAEAILEWSE